MSAAILVLCAQGMDYLHSKRIVHFDLKTANLLVGFRCVCVWHTYMQSASQR